MADDFRQGSRMPKLEPDNDIVKQNIKQEHLYCHEIKAEPFIKGNLQEVENASKITFCSDQQEVDFIKKKEPFLDKLGNFLTNQFFFTSKHPLFPL